MSTKTEVVDNKKQTKQPKEKKPNKVVKATKETFSELKKVTWPEFMTVVKKTGVVLVFVVIFAAVFFGMDRLLSWLFGYLI